MPERLSAQQVPPATWDSVRGQLHALWGMAKTGAPYNKRAWGEFAEALAEIEHACRCGARRPRRTLPRDLG